MGSGRTRQSQPTLILGQSGREKRIWKQAKDKVDNLRPPTYKYLPRCFYYMIYDE